MPMSPLKIAVTGAAGRMGATLVRHIYAHADCTLVGASETPGHTALGKDVGALAGLGEIGVRLSDNPDTAFADAEAIIDFTSPVASLAHAKIAASHSLIHVIGTTGLNADEEREIAKAAARAVIVKSGNMSLGVNLLAALTREAARHLGEEFDIEIVEMHHRHKVDAPSGTALLLGAAAAAGRGAALDKLAVHGRQGPTGPRPRGAIGFASLRGGSVVGDHTVILAGDSERIELTHRAEDRGIFARGALKAALWGRGRPPGLYSMADVLGLD